MQNETTNLAYSKALLDRCTKAVWQIPEDQLLESLTATNQKLEELLPKGNELKQQAQNWRREFLGPTESTAEELRYQLFASYFWLLGLFEAQSKLGGQS